MPLRPWRASPERHATAASISAGSSLRRHDASSPILALRPGVSATRRDVSTTSTRSVIGLGARPIGGFHYSRFRASTSPAPAGLGHLPAALTGGLPSLKTPRNSLRNAGLSWCPCTVTACCTAASRSSSSLSADIAIVHFISLGNSRQSMYLRGTMISRELYEWVAVVVTPEPGHTQIHRSNATSTELNPSSISMASGTRSRSVPTLGTRPNILVDRSGPDERRQ